MFPVLSYVWSWLWSLLCFSSSILHFRHGLLICQLHHGGLLIPSALLLHWLSFSMSSTSTSRAWRPRRSMEPKWSRTPAHPQGTHTGEPIAIETMVEQRPRWSWWGWQPEQSWRPPGQATIELVDQEAMTELGRKGNIKVHKTNPGTCDSVAQPLWCI